MSKTPVTVFTGFLGAGKTTIILDLIAKSNGINLVVLKNEFGDTQVDSKLLSSHIAVTEITNGCLCCVLVGQIKNALEELLKLEPDRIIIETSGSAFPAPIAWQIREIDHLHLDSIITVIDCENFRGYADTSYTAKLQSQYTDLILMNKHEFVSDRAYDLCLDYVNDLNTDTIKLKYDKNMGLNLFFGLDTKLFKSRGLIDNVEFKDHSEREVDLIQITQDVDSFDTTALEKKLSTISRDDVYRIKGLFPVQKGKSKLLNWAFSRWEWHSVDDVGDKLSVTVMGLGLAIHLNSFNSLFPNAQVKLSLGKRN